MVENGQELASKLWELVGDYQEALIIEEGLEGKTDLETVVIAHDRLQLLRQYKKTLEEFVERYSRVRYSTGEIEVREGIHYGPRRT